MIPDEENAGALDVVHAIAAGQPVNWASIESSVDGSASLLALLRELKVIENIAALGRGPGEERAVAPIAEADSWGALRRLERVGQGAFGVVYRAWDPRLDREVALKLLRHPESIQDSLGSLVIDEGRLLARVRHPNVVTVYGADRIDGRVGLWMEFVRGRTLEEGLRDHGPFGAQEATLVGLDVCRALAAVHRAGLIHRDIKAHNVVREGGGRIVLMDFGTGCDDFDTQEAELAGTPLYLAPELFDHAASTVQSDIYSVGVLLYHLATASYPVQGRTLAELKEAHGRQRRVWLRDERPDLPDAFVNAVERALALDPLDRYESAGAMEAALTRVVLPATSPDLAGRTPPPSVRKTPWRPRRTLIVAATVAFALTAAAMFVSASRGGRLLGSRGGSPPQAGSPDSPPASSVVMRKVVLSGSRLMGTPSPDGTLFSQTDSTGNVAVASLATGEVHRVTDDAFIGDGPSQYAEFSAISTDSHFIAYTWYALDGKYEIRVASIGAKRPRVLLRSDSIDYPLPLEWSRDDHWILALLTRADHAASLALIGVEDGTVHPVKELGTAAPLHASLSPDGRFVVYDAPEHDSASNRDVFIVRADGSDVRRLHEHPANDVAPVWTPDGRAVLFASDRSGAMDLWAVGVEEGVAQGDPHLIHRDMGRMVVSGLTMTGRFFYYATVGAVDVYSAELSEQAASDPISVSSSHSGSNISSVWSPDGERIAYASRRGLVGFDRGSTTLVTRDLRTGEQREIVPAMNSFLVRSWSPDGRSVLVTGQDVRGRSGNHQIDVETGRVAPLAVADRPSNETDIRRGDWMPDGKVLFWHLRKRALITHDVQTAEEEVVLDLRAAGIEPVHNIGGRGYKLGPDGQTLAYSSATGDDAGSTSALSIKSLRTGETRVLARFSYPERVLFQDWTPDGEAILFTRGTAQSNAPALWRLSIQGGEPQPLGLSLVGLRDVSVHPDGSRVTFTAGFPRNDLWVMENFLPGQ